MVNVKAIICSLLIVLTGLYAQAYESDTHLRLMYHLARAVGFNDEVSKYLAIGNQHIDMNMMSSPMFTPSQRHLFHFPGELDKVNIEGHGAISLYAQISGESKLALATRNHPLGSYLIYQGLQKGDLMLVSLGMHIKMDTYGHAGFSNLLGHMDRGHNPDRAFLEPKKYEEMIRSVMQTLIQLREVMPESALDDAAALKYLSKHSKNTFLKRELTAADLKNSQIIAEVLINDKELQKIFREDIFRKYEYKKIALEKIFRKFQAEQIIKRKVAFRELFNEGLLRDHRLDTTQTLKHVILNNLDAEFIRSGQGREVFNLRKLFGYKDENMFREKFNVEKVRAEMRLKQLFYLMESENDDRMYDKELTERIEQEKAVLLTGMRNPEGLEIGSGEFIKARAIQVAEERIAEEVAFKLTKDLIPHDPREYNEYVKQNFEGESDNRLFENHYKDELYRLKFVRDWGVNWVLDERKGVFTRLAEAIVGFKNFILKIKTPIVRNKWRTFAEKSAREFMSLEINRDFAQAIGFNNKNKRDAFFKLARFVLPAMLPYFGMKYILNITRAAKLYAKDHEVEDMKKAVERGKYKADILANSRKAAQNIEIIRQSTKMQCVYFFE